jgi:hypothetical protein
VLLKRAKGSNLLLNESGGSQDGTGTISGRYGDVLPMFSLQIYTYAKG